MPRTETWDEKRERLVNLNNLRCRRCSKQTQSLSLHHIIPRELYGSDDDDNLIPLCNDCHNWVELNLEFQPLLRTRIGIMNSKPVSLLKSIPGVKLETGYREPGDKIDIWLQWIKQDRKGAKALIEKHGSVITVESLGVTEILTDIRQRALKRMSNTRSNTMTKEEYERFSKMQ